MLKKVTREGTPLLTFLTKNIYASCAAGGETGSKKDMVNMVNMVKSLVNKNIITGIFQILFLHLYLY